VYSAGYLQLYVNVGVLNVFILGCYTINVHINGIEASGYKGNQAALVHSFQPHSYGESALNVFIPTQGH
jgi:hypothetical protein